VYSNSFIIICAFLIDFVIGDPRWFPHPVRALGWIIGKFERSLRRFARTAHKEKMAGIILVVVTVSLTYVIAQMIIIWSFRFSLKLGIIVSIFLAFTTLAARSLAEAAWAVMRRIDSHNIDSARQELSLIVGRDTQKLDETGICRAVIETVAENTSDGVIAPLFYLMMGGPALALAYKAVNTLDSMIGYKNEKYINFGWAAARLDDVVNYIPARITAVMICIVSDIQRGLKKILSPYQELRTSTLRLYSPWRTMVRDGGKHPSPNSGYPEAAVAGALGIRLGGPSTYGGLMNRKPYIGAESHRITKKHVEMSVRLMYSSSLLTALAASMQYLKHLLK
jgi:adenosylcobinamide-phosphate synthase